MGKCVFKEYNITLHGKKYKVLVPGMEISEMWVELWETRYQNGNWDYAILNRKAFEYLRSGYIALWQDPYYIIYFPIKNVERINEFHFTQFPPEFVLYTHQLQLKRREWKDIKKCMKYIKPKQRVIRYLMPDLMKDCDHMMRAWEKKKTFYIKHRRIFRDEEKVFYQYETCFIESSKSNSYQ